MELTLLITWFNPFSWLISRMIKENHEHLADRQVLSAGVNPARYRAQLLNHTLGVNVFRLGNQFNHSLTFKRFKMMKKPKRSPWGVLKIALMVPAVMIALGLTTGMTPQDKLIRGKVIIADTKEPAPGAAVIIAGTTVGTVTDINGEFALQVDGDPEIVISFVGYSTLRVKSSRINDKPLALEKTVYHINLDEIPEEDHDKAVITGSISFKKSDQSEASPVFVLDGKEVTEINDLDPGTIEKVEVIKDPDSEIAKKYNAKDGVILITTKKQPTVSPEVKKSTDPYEKDVFYVVEDMPSFPGGNAALKSYIDTHLQYPEDAIQKGIKGIVYVQFTVKTNGKLDDIHVVRSVYAGFDQAAQKVIENMPDWNPAMQRGKAVAVNVVVPVKFNRDME
jgi:TonB family protein